MRILKESGYYDVTVDDLVRMRDQIDKLIEMMDETDTESITPESNTYRLYDFLSIGSKGFIDLANIYKYVKGYDTSEDDIIDEWDYSEKEDTYTEEDD